LKLKHGKTHEDVKTSAKYSWDRRSINL